VQCTRCGHVFTVLPDGSVAPPVASAVGLEGGQEGEPVREGTLVFGQAREGGRAGAAVPGRPGHAGDPPPSRTQVFGAVKLPEPSELEPRTSTQVFGAVPAMEPLPARTPASGALPAMASRTPRSGAFPSTEKDLEMEPRAPTRVFGALTPLSQDELTSPKTQIFGVTTQPSAGSPGGAPLGVGPGSASVSGPRKLTQAFGTAVEVAPAPVLPSEEPRHKTSVFGAVTGASIPSLPPVSPLASLPPGPAEARVSSAPSVPKPSSTQMFGMKELEARIAAASAPAPSGLDASELFSVEVTPEVEAPLPSGFPELGTGEPVHPGVSPMTSPLGAPAKPAPGTAARDPFDRLGESQQPAPRRSGDFPVPGMPRRTGEFAAQGGGSSPAPRRTGDFTVPGAPGEPAPRRTGDFTVPGAPGEPAPRRTGDFAVPGGPGESGPRRTGDFAVPGGPGEPAPQRRSGPFPVPGSPGEVAPKRSGPFAVPGAPGESLPRRSGEHGRLSSPRSSEHVPISLPPEAPVLNLGTPAVPDDIEAAALARFEARAKRRTRLLWVGVLVGVLGAAGFVAYRIDAARRAAVPQAIFNGLDDAQALLRKDDAASQEKAVAQFSEIVVKQPALLEARAALLLALSLRVDDSRLSLRRIELETDVLGRRMTKLQEEHSPSDWQNRVNAMQEQREALQAQVEPLNVKLRALDTRLTETFTSLPAQLPPESSRRDEIAFVRAQSIYFGVRGLEQAMVAAEHYRTLGAKDGWDAIALSEYALNGRVAPETLTEAYKQLDALIAADASFLRAYVLSARIALQQKRFEAAANALDSTQALNPAHELSLNLLSWIRQSDRAETDP